MNYYDRLDSYRRRNYFQINQPYLDIYGPTVPVWADKVDVVSDILKFASSAGLGAEYDILSIRVIGPMIDLSTKERLLSTLDTANQLLADELGSSDLWEEMKGEGAAKRHFLTITVSAPKIEKVTLPPIEEINEPHTEKLETGDEADSIRKPRSVRTVPDNKGSV